MKKHLISAFSLVSLLAGTAAPALAHDGKISLSASAEVRAGIKEDRREFRDEQKDERREFREDQASKSREFRADIKERLSGFRKERIKQWWAKAARRLHNLIERQRKLAARIEARLEKLSAAGKDVSDQRKALVEARVKIDASAAALASASAQVDVILSDNTPREAFRKLHELHKGVIGKIREAHYALVRIIVSLKAFHSPSPSPSPTATP